MNGINSSKEMDSFTNNSKPRIDVPYKVISTNIDQTQSIKAQETKLASELQEHLDRQKERDSFTRNNPKHQKEENQAEDTAYGSEVRDVDSTVCSKETETIPKMKSKDQADAPTDINQTESIKPQGSEHGLEMQDIVDTEKERDSFLKHRLKLQGAASGEVHTHTNQTEGGESQGMGHDLELQWSTNKEKERDSFTENKSKPQGDVSNGAKKNIAKQNNSEAEKKIIEKVVKHKSVDKSHLTFAPGDLREKRVRYKEKHARIQVLTLGDSLEAYLPSLKTMILDRKYRHCDLICKLDKLKQYAPTDATYSKCIFLIDLDEQTGRPILGIFTDGKVQKHWEGRQLYHPNILEVAEVFEKLISASEWKVGRGNKGFWRNVHICCNKLGELLVLLLVQSPEEKAREAIQRMKTLFTKFFEKGEGKKCKIASVYAQVTFTSTSASPDHRISSLTELIMGNEQYEDYILGFKLRMTPKVPTIWGMEQSCMMCEVVKDLLALDDYTTVLIVGIIDCGLLALALAKDAGEVICVDKVPIIEDVKQNVRLNNLESKCKFYAGFATEEVRKITPKYKKVHAVVMVPTVAKLMALKIHKNLSCVKSIIIFLESSNISSAPLMALGDTERGMSFFPSRIIPFDTHLDDKDYMMAIRTEKVDVPKTDTHGKSSSRRSSGRTWSQEHRGRVERTWHSRDHSAAERRERNRMLPDAREVIVARRHNKEKEQLMSTSRFRSDEHPNLVIEVKKPNFDNYEQRRYVKERTKEADGYRQIIEERDPCTRAEQRVHDVLKNSLRRHLPNLDENTTKKLNEVITDAIVGSGLFDSSHQRKKLSFAVPRVTDYESEHYLKYHQNDNTAHSYDSHILYPDDDMRNEATEYDYINGKFQRQSKEDNCDITSAIRTSHDYPNIEREAIRERELLSDGRSVQIDTRETLDRISTCDQQNIDTGDTYSEIEAFRSRKRGLEIDISVNQLSEKKKRSQDQNAYENRCASSVTSSSVEVAPYCNTQHTKTTLTQYVLSEGSKRNGKLPEIHSYVTEQDRDRRDVTNRVTQIPFNAKDLRHTAEKNTMLPQVSFGVFPSGGTAHLGPRLGMYRHLVRENTLSNAVHPAASVQGNMDVPQLPNIEFRRLPPYPPFMPPH